jgi:hypothetical protein
VSVPRAKSTNPAATATAEPELAVRAARSHKTRGELVEVGLADRDGPRGQETLDDGRRCVGRIGEGGTGRRGGQARQVDIVLHRKGQAGQGQALAGLEAAVDVCGGGQHLVFGEPGDPGLGLDRIVGRHAIEGGAGGGEGCHAGSRAMIGAPAATASFSRA